MKRLISALVLALGLSIVPAVVNVAPASASPLKCPSLGSGNHVNLPGSWTWATINPTNNRSVGWAVGIVGNPGDRYVRIDFCTQDLIDTGAGGDGHAVCIQFATPGTNYFWNAACDTNSSDWLYNGTGLITSWTSDTWADGPPCGYRVRVVASDETHPFGSNQRVVYGPGKILGCW